MATSHPLDSIASAKKGSANNKKVMYPKKNC
jgi:hypothetical protein